MMARKLKVAISGLGRIGWDFHAQQLKQSSAFSIAAVNDPVCTRREEGSACFHCPAYADFETMLKEVSLDAVVIATPTHLHKPMALSAFRHNLHVILEKPMALDSREAAIIVNAAKRKDRLLTVYQPHRLQAYFQHIKKLVDSGRIGRVYRAQIGLFSFSRRNDWQSLRKFGGGMLNNYGAHGMDQLLQLIGYDVRRCFGTLQRVATLGDADDSAKVVVETRHGVLGELDISQASAIKPYRINLWGTCGGLQMGHDNVIRLRWFDPSLLPAKKINRSLASEDRRYPSDAIEWQEEKLTIDESLGIDLYANVSAAIRRKEKLAVHPDETLKLMKLLDRLKTDAGKIRDFRH